METCIIWMLFQAISWLHPTVHFFFCFSFYKLPDDTITLLLYKRQEEKSSCCIEIWIFSGQLKTIIDGFIDMRTHTHIHLRTVNTRLKAFQVTFTLATSCSRNCTVCESSVGMLQNISLWSQMRDPKQVICATFLSPIILITAEFAQLKPKGIFDYDKLWIISRSCKLTTHITSSASIHHVLSLMSCLCNESINATLALIRSLLFPPDPTLEQFVCRVCLFFIISVWTVCVRARVHMWTHLWVCACLCDP